MKKIVYIFIFIIMCFSIYYFIPKNNSNIIAVNNLKYQITIDGKATALFKANKNDITKTNIIIKSSNNENTNYELIYHICNNKRCNRYIENDNINILYSSNTIDDISGTINSESTKTITIMTTNKEHVDYYIKLDLNASKENKELILANQINEKYEDDNLLIAAYIDGELSTTFPNNSNYAANVICTSNGSTSTATGIVTWNGSKWILNVSNIEKGKTKCNIEFYPMPEKGDLITMDVGDGLPDTYRVLKLEGTEALVLAMQDYNVGTIYTYNETYKTTTFGSYTGQQYAGSDLDILLNTTMYGEMNSTAKSAIVAKNINQNMFSYSGQPNELEESEPYTHDYQYQYTWINDWKNIDLEGTVNVGSRYVYALDVADIYEYIGRRYISSSELNKMFFNKNTSYTGNSTMGNQLIWLRSAYGNDGNRSWSVDGDHGKFDNKSRSTILGTRAAFVIDLSKIDWEYDMPNKGQLITMDVGDGLPDTYRVLKLDGTEALVLAMRDYNVGTEYPYNEISKTTSFNGIEGQQYAGSDLDILLNTTMYGEMNSTAKSAIVAKNIDQNMFSYSDPPNELEESEPYTYDYQYQYNWNNNDWENLDLVGTVNVGSRYVYALDVADIYEYIGRRYISSSELNEMFFNQTTQYDTNSTMGYEYIWLRSADSYNSSYARDVNGNYGRLCGYDSWLRHGARAAFVIDLSKIEYEEVDSVG